MFAFIQARAYDSESMTPKYAALVAFIGSLLLTLVFGYVLLRDLGGLMGGAIPMVTILHDIVCTFAAASACNFFYVFQKN